MKRARRTFRAEPVGVRRLRDESSQTPKTPDSVERHRHTAPCSSRRSRVARTPRNPSVMLAAGLLAKKAVEKGLTVNPAVKTSLAPGSRVVTDYLNKTGLQTVSRQARLQHSSATAARPASATPARSTAAIEDAIAKNDLVAASRALRQPQLRGARAPEHQGELPHVAAARRRLRARRPRGHRPEQRAARQRARTAQPVYLARHLADARRKSATRCSPRSSRKSSASSTRISPRRIRSGTKSRPAPATSTNGIAKSTYIQEPPFFDELLDDSPAASREINGARALGIFGDSVTTDHISPAGAIKKTSPAGKYLHRERRRRSRTSTATARAAATTAS